MPSLSLMSPQGGRRGRSAGLSLALCLWLAAPHAANASGTSPAPASASGPADEQALAKSLLGRLIVAGTTFYRVAEVESIDAVGGSPTLKAEGDPLFEAAYSGNPDGEARGRSYYDVTVPPSARCGAANASTRIDTSNFLVFHQGEFVPLAEAFPQAGLRSNDRPVNRVTPALLSRLNACAKSQAALADAMPFRRIAIHAGSDLITEVTRTHSDMAAHEEFPGDELIAKMSHVAITPKPGRSLKDFAVQVRAVSVMRCDYEGPHIELDAWKQGLGPWVQLERKGDHFRIGASLRKSAMPAFPSYTQTELRRAIAQQFGNSGLASKQESKPCAPFLRGYRFHIHYRSQLVQEISLDHAGGC